MDAIRLFNSQCATIDDHHNERLGHAAAIRAAAAEYVTATHDVHGRDAMFRYADDTIAAAAAVRLSRKAEAARVLADELASYEPFDIERWAGRR